ncbi:WD repeat-containing protein 75-like isoform X2 [Branchiostoma floridae x Branchiostoma belcheri]
MAASISARARKNMAASMDGEMAIVQKAGANLVSERPVFSPDSRYVLCCCGFVVKVFSMSSGECVRQLTGHKDFITGVKINPHNQFQAFTSSLDKTVKVWDYPDGKLLKTFSVGCPVHALYLLKEEEDAGYAVIRNKDNTFSLVQFHWTNIKGHTIRVETREVLKGVSRHEKHLAFGPEGSFIASVTRNKLTVLFTKSGKVKEFERPRNEFQCVTCHPTDACIATGMQDGKIFLWRGLFQKKEVVRTIYHWHTLPVGDLTFSPEGTHLMSVGQECVLVLWQYNTEKKDFLPRMGSPLCYINSSPDGSLLAVSQVENVVQIVTRSNKVVQVFQGLTRVHIPQLIRSTNPVPTGLLLDPRSQTLVLNGRPGHLQWYNLHTDRHLYNLDIVWQNFVSSRRPWEAPEVVYTEIERMAFDQGGDWLATLERRADGMMAEEVKLKFWSFNKEKQSFELNTTVDCPHQGKVNTLVFQPRSDADLPPTAVSAGDDGKFKTWTLIDDTDIYRENVCWSCDSVGTYRDLEAKDVAFSEDGSLLAVAFGQSLTIWDPYTIDLKTTFCHTFCTEKENIRQVKFGHGNCSHYLITTTPSNLSVWNILSCSLLWTVSCECAVLVADPLSEYMAVFSATSDLTVFKPSSPEPVYTHNKGVQSSVVAAVFFPKQNQESGEQAGEAPWQKWSELYFMTYDQDLLTLQKEAPQQTRKDITEMLESHLPPTPFSMYLSQVRTDGQGEESHAPVQHGTPGAVAVQQMLQTPAHVLPPVSTLCQSFLQMLLVSKSSTERQDDEDMESESDEEEKNNQSETSDSEMEEDSAANDASTAKQSTSQSERDNSSHDQTSNQSALDKLHLKETEDFSSIKTSDLSWMKSIF